MALKEYKEVTMNVGLFELSDFVCFRITGKDTRDFLNRVLTNNIRDLATGSGCYGCLCDRKGKILADLHCYAGSEFFLIECHQTLKDKIREILKRYIIIEDVQIGETLPWQGRGIIGPKAGDLLRSWGLKPPDKNLQFDLIPSGVLVRKNRWGLEGFEWWGDKELFEKGEGGKISPETQEILRIESKTPLYGVDMTEENIPQEAGLDEALNFNKGCYVGQETIARLEHRGHVNKGLVLLKVEGDIVPPPSTKIATDSGEEIGHVTSSCFSPKYNAPIAMGYVRYSYLSEKEFRIAGRKASQIF